MEIIQSVKKMQDISLSLRRLNETVGFVPTMGYLHKGHTSLIEKAKNDCSKVILSIFVNPIQFGENEDYEKYPKDFNRDKFLAEAAGADYVFVPSAREMYPKGSKATIKVRDLDSVMCGSFRPGHFEGVCTVVAKLFNITLPQWAYFGLKDYQQYLIIKKMVEDLNFPLRIVGCPIIREDDGVAMSSRNKYLSKNERKNAVILNECLNQAANLIENGLTNLEHIRNTMCEKLSGNPFVSAVDYFDFRDSETLQSISSTKKHDFKKTGSNLLIACAVRIGGTRLIDNIVFDVARII